MNDYRMIKNLRVLLLAYSYIDSLGKMIDGFTRFTAIEYSARLERLQSANREYTDDNDNVFSEWDGSLDSISFDYNNIPTSADVRALRF